MVDDLPQVVAAGNLIFDLAEDLPDFIFDGVRVAALLREPAQVGKEFPVDEIEDVVAGQGFVVVELAIGTFGRGSAFPSVRLIKDEDVLLPLQLGLHRLVLFQIIDVFQKKQPGGLLGVVQLGGATGLFPENVIDVFESLSEHGHHL